MNRVFVLNCRSRVDDHLSNHPLHELYTLPHQNLALEQLELKQHLVLVHAEIPILQIAPQSSLVEYEMVEKPETEFQNGQNKNGRTCCLRASLFCRL